MKIWLKLLFGFYIFLLLLPTSAFASTFTISSTQTDIDDTTQVEIPVTLNINQESGTNYYLRGEFYKDGTHTYCGYTWNGTDWYNGPYSNAGWKNLLKATIQDNTWSDKLYVKIDDQAKGCQDSGQYLFKVVRYTEEKGSTSDTDNTITFQVTLPSPTPVATDIPTVKTTPTSADPTVSKVPTPPKAIASPKISTSVKNLPKVSQSAIQSVLAAKSASLSANQSSSSGLMHYKPSVSPKKTPEVTPKVMGVSQRSSSYIFFIIGGVLLLVVCGILGFRKFREQNID